MNRNRFLSTAVLFGFLCFNGLAEDRLVNDDTGTASQTRPVAAMHPWGPAVIAWQDKRNGNDDIYFQLYSRRGVEYPGKGNMKVNDDATTAYQHYPDAAMDGRGHFAIVWMDARSGQVYTYAQAYYANGTPKGSNVKVFDGAGGNINYYPKAAMDGAGNCMVVWSDSRVYKDKSNIYAQRFNPDFSKAGANFLVHVFADSEQFNPDIGMNGAGKAVVAWGDERSGVSRIWARRFSPGGNPIGSEFLVSSHPSAGWECNYPSVAVQQDGSFAVAWKVSAGEDEMFYASVFDSTGTPKNSPQRIDEAGKFPYSTLHQIAWYPGGLYMIVFNAALGPGGWDVFTNRFNNMGVITGMSHAVNEPEGIESNCDAAADSNANAIFVWDEFPPGVSGDQGNIYAAWEGYRIPNYLTAGSGFNGMVPLSWIPPYGETGTLKYTVWRAESPSGPFALNATVDPSTRLLPAQMLDIIDRTVVNGKTYYYKVRVDGAGDASKIVSATPSASGHSLSSRWTAASPTIDGRIQADEWQNAAKLNIAAPSARHAVTLYVMNNAGTLFVAADDSNDALLEGVNAMGMLFDDNNSRTWPSTGTAGEGLFTVGQSQTTFTSYWGTYPDALGAGTTQTAAGVTGSASMSSGHVQYEAAINLSTSALKTSPGQTIGVLFAVKDPGTFYPEQYDYAGQWPRGGLLEAAETLGSLTLATSTDVQTEPDSKQPGAFALYPNFPNPFNPTTAIPFDVKESCKVVMTVCDLNGREVSVPVNRDFSPGRYQAVVDASQWPAGVYICRIRMGSFEAARKMAFIK